MIKVDNLTKRYGSKTAVDQLSFELAPGKVTGFLGPNGSGKSTTMRCIVGLDRPTAGRCTIRGVEYSKLSSPLTTVGALLDGHAFHPGRTARQQLRVVADTHGFPKSRVDEVLELTGITSVADKRLKGFSLGMGQRVGIATALMGDPEILIFDEPVNGLDPDGVRWVRELCRTLAGQGRTVLVSSHLMSEMAQTADNLVIIGKGRLIRQGDIREFTESASHTTVHIAGPDIRAIAHALSSAGIAAQAHPASERHPEGLLDVAAGDRRQIGHILHQAGLEIHELSETYSSLEDVFMELTADQVEYGSGGRQGAVPAEATQGPPAGGQFYPPGAGFAGHYDADGGRR
ncbi:MAG: ATP-binding cassette domain-containing protein [Actinomycetaceae bacterium]|nr:ATP-binding cassette domain-containing protein [Actinomycetaceae bacterium]